MKRICGFGPVAVSAVRDLLDTGDRFLAAVLTHGGEVAGVAHLRRRPNALQQTALEWLYPSWAVEGCSASTWLENDHRLDWATSGLTVLALLDRLCSHHHDRKALDGWSLVHGRVKRPFVPPQDPPKPAMPTRHPRRRHDYRRPALVRGSRTSRRPSPRRLKPRTMRKMAAPGKNIMFGARLR